MTRGWCPGVHEPMPSGDGLLVRVKPPGGLLPAAALRAIANAARQHGNGIIELTSRGNLQVRGLTQGSAPHFAAAMVNAGLADADPARERRRNVITVPPANAALALSIEAVLADTPGLATKFCVALGPAAADLVVLDGMIWAEGCAEPFTLDTLRRLAEGARGRRLTLVRPVSQPIDGLLLAVPFGQTDATALEQLASLTDTARTTPWRALHIPTPPNAAPYEAAGFITDRSDPRLRIAACVGAPACASGAMPARADAARLAAWAVTGLHVSGCSKGCAKAAAGLTLVGRNGGYDFVIGHAYDPPTRTGLSLEQAADCAQMHQLAVGSRGKAPALL